MMPGLRQLTWAVVAAFGTCCLAQAPPDSASAADASAPAAAQAPAGTENAREATPGGPGKLTVTVGKSLIIDSPLNIQRISVANGDLVEAVAVGPKEVLINGKAPGDTSLIVWQQGAERLFYDLTVRIGTQKLDAAREQIARDFPDADISLTFDNDTAFVRGTVKDMFAADRVMAIAKTLGKTVNLLNVKVPDVEPEILLKVRFADVDRSASQDLGANIASAAFNQSTGITTGVGGGTAVDQNGIFSLSQALNIFLFRNDIHLGAVIQALESKRLLQMLAEPNLLAINGKEASFVQGGEFPFPMVQPGANGGVVTLAFREYGIRLNFLPQITPRGTIRLKVAPEVSALDFTNSVTVMGTTVPGLSTRRVQTEVELESGQSFVIAGLMDNTLTQTIAKIPGLAAIPLLGKLFQSRSQSRANSELLVIVTPELVRPIPVGKPVPDLKYPGRFMTENTTIPNRQPGLDQTGPVPVHPPSETMPVEQLQQQTQEAPAPAPAIPLLQLLPPVQPPQVNPGLAPTPAAGSGTNGR